MDETGYAPLRASAKDPPAPGFRLSESRDIHGLVVYRFTSTVPVTDPGAGATETRDNARPSGGARPRVPRENHLAFTPMSMQIAEPVSEAQLALERAGEHLLCLQDESGWWKGELQTNVTMDAEDMLLREFLGIRDSEETERSAVWIRSQQRDDGTWPIRW